MWGFSPLFSFFFSFLFILFYFFFLPLLHFIESPGHLSESKLLTIFRERERGEREIVGESPGPSRFKCEWYMSTYLLQHVVQMSVQNILTY